MQPGAEKCAWTPRRLHLAIVVVAPQNRRKHLPIPCLSSLPVREEQATPSKPQQTHKSNKVKRGKNGRIGYFLVLMAGEISPNITFSKNSKMIKKNECERIFMHTHTDTYQNHSGLPQNHSGLPKKLLALPQKLTSLPKSFLLCPKRPQFHNPS